MNFPGHSTRFPASVRARAATGATAVVAVALVAACAAVLVVLRANLTDQAGLQAEVAAREVAAALATGTGADRLDLPDGEDHPVQVVDEEGRVVAASPGLERMSGTGAPGVTALPRSAPGTDDEAGGDNDRDDDDRGDDDRDDNDRHGRGHGRGRGGDTDRDDDPGRGEVASGTVGTSSGAATVDGESAPYRFAAVEATTPQGETVTVYAGAPLATGQRAVGVVRDSMLVGLPALLAVVAAVTWLVTRRALQPVEGIRREMAGITASTDLSRRVPEPRTGDEVARLARTTNTTLAALEAAVERHRRFVADASHELRSPIASLRTQLEVGAAHPGLLDLDGAVEDTVRLQQLAADLLLLARLDAGEPPKSTTVPLADLVREVLARRAGSDRFPVSADTEDLRVTGSRGQLARVLGNLLDNAQRHAESAVAVRLRGDGRYVLLEVADDGPGVPEDQRERIFERFVRLDDARSRDAGGAGLGLAIARDVAVSHGGSLTVGASPAAGALFTLRLPRAAGHTAPDGDRAAG